MRVLVTGGAGFIGSHMVEHLIRNTDHEVVVIDTLNYAGDMDRLSHLKGSRLKFIHHDLQGVIYEEKAKRLGQFDFILNFAAESHVDVSLKDPRRFALSNVIGTVNMLEFLREYQTDCKLFIQISTDEVFGAAPAGTFYKEWDRLNPSNPYSASKAGADCFALSYTTSFGLPIVITRTMNNFGERQHPEKYVAMCMRKITAGETVTVHGNDDVIGSRCWLHARNHADGVAFLMDHYDTIDKGDIFNISGDEYTNLEIAQFIAEDLGKELNYELVDFHSTRPGHDLRYALDNSKMKELGWVNPIEFRESLRRTVLWTQKHKEWLYL